MNYINQRTGLRVDLADLALEQQGFYREAMRRYRQNIAWSAFEEFAFGMRSPIYASRTSHLDVLKDPLYQALRDMWLALGIRQGRVAKERVQEKPHAPRRSQSRSRPAAHQRNAKEARKLAVAHSSAGSHS